MKQLLFLALATLLVSPLQAADLLKDFDSLGGNDVLMERAKALNPDAKVGIVQDRVVNRRNRIELAPEFAGVVGGDAYNSTQNVGGNFYFHFNPYIAAGLKYNYSFNQLRPEAEYLIGDTSGTGTGVIPDIDYPKSTTMALVHFYPIYGKMNMYDLGVTHFDFYGLAGYGEVETRSNKSPTWTAGGGLGMWFSQHLSGRLELRYQNYKAKRFNGTTDMNLTVASVQVGILL